VISVVFGVLAALIWGGGTLALREAARSVPAHAFALWFSLYSVILLVPLAAIAATHGVPAAVVLATSALAGVAQATGTLVYGRALATTDVVVIGPLVALEGAFATIYAVLAGHPLGLEVAAGLILVTVGGAAVGIPRRAATRTGGAGLAVVAAAMYGLVLWAVGSDEANTAITLVTLNGVATVALGSAARTMPAPRALALRSHTMLAIGAGTNVAGYFAYAAGARGGSLPVTAVLGAQFAIVAAAGGYVLHGERLSRRQLAGVALLLVGVSTLAAWG
jgi:uncharacterized membrane protein